MRSREDRDAAHIWLMIAQVAVDLFSCVLIAALAAILALMVSEQATARRVFVAGIWLAALCPFTANYTAVTLTEVFAIFFTAAALIPLCLMIGRTRNNGWLFIKREWWYANNYRYLAALQHFWSGVCTLFRPESPLLLIAAWIVLAVILFSQHEAKRWIQTIVGMGSDLRDSVAAVDGAERDHVARISAAGAEIFESAGRTCSVWIHELGEDVAVSISRRLSGVVEAER